MHKVVVRVTKNGYFVDRGNAQPLKFGKIGGEIKAMPTEYIYDGTFGTGYYSRARAIAVAHEYEWRQPVEIVFDEPEAFAEPQ